MLWQNFLSPEFRTKFQRKVPFRILPVEWLLLRYSNLSNIGGRVYVRVGIRVSVRVIFSITWPARTRSPMFDRLERRNNSHDVLPAACLHCLQTAKHAQYYAESVHHRCNSRSHVSNSENCYSQTVDLILEN